jgi:hypothetical protein
MSHYTPPTAVPGSVYPQPPRKKSKAVPVTIAICSTLFVIVVCAFGAVLFNSGGGGKADRQTAGAVSASPSHKSTDGKPAKAAYDPKHDVKLHGIKTTHVDYVGDQRWISYTVTNHSKKEQDYALEFGLYNASGKRIGEAYTLTDNVNPGESVDSSMESGGMIVNEDGQDDPRVKSVQLLRVTVVPSQK